MRRMYRPKNKWLNEHCVRCGEAVSCELCIGKHRGVILSSRVYHTTVGEKMSSFSVSQNQIVAATYYFSCNTQTLGRKEG